MLIVEKIEKGDIAYDFRNNDLAKLPKEYRDLSAAQISTGHHVVAVENVNDKKCVYFYIFDGMTDNDQGFVYVPDDGIIDTMRIGVPYCHNIFYELSGKRKIKKHWYLISNT